MNQRTMVKVSAEENTFSIRTFSRKGRSPQRFVFLQKELDMLEEKGYVLTSDIHSFARMELYTTASGAQAVQIIFTWLQDAGGGSISGREETVRLPLEKWKECLEASRNQGGAYQSLLSIEEKHKPQIIFHSRKNLKEVAQRKVLRKKLGRFLDRSFNWHGTKQICITDDFYPYSFFFTEDKGNGKGICGGIILHGQENLPKAYYGIHT